MTRNIDGDGHTCESFNGCSTVIQVAEFPSSAARRGPAEGPQRPCTGPAKSLQGPKVTRKRRSSRHMRQLAASACEGHATLDTSLMGWRENEQQREIAPSAVRCHRQLAGVHIRPTLSGTALVTIDLSAVNGPLETI